MSWPRFAIVGHPNKGKSSIVATFAEDDAIAISPHPGTTTRARAYPMRLDGETLYELIDTPGFQRARETLTWLESHDRGAGARAAVVREFVTAHRDEPRFHDECELLRPIVDGAGILYVVDGSRPYGHQYEAEMEILRWTGRPRMALINLISAGDHVEEWRAALTQYFSIVRVFDAVRADFGKRVDLLRAFGAIEESWAGQLNRAADALVADRERRKRRAAGEIADLLIATLSATVTTPLRDQHADEPAIAAARDRLRDEVRRRERAERRAVQEIYHHATLTAHESTAAYLIEDVFTERSFNVFGLSGTQLALTGAASGALVGGVVDAALGGASLLLAPPSAPCHCSARSRVPAARGQILGQPLGGHDSRGPDHGRQSVVLLGALLHLTLLAGGTRAAGAVRHASRRASRRRDRRHAAPQARCHVSTPPQRARHRRGRARSADRRDHGVDRDALNTDPRVNAARNALRRAARSRGRT
jgi:hypothetical protein